MKRIAPVIAALVLLATPIRPENPAGRYANITTSPVTGDMGGFALNIKKDKGGYAGTLMIAQGQPGEDEPLKNVACDDHGGFCTFKCKIYDDYQDCAMARIPGGAAVLFLKRDRYSYLLFSEGKVISLAPPDSFAWATGAVYAGPSKSSKVLYTLPDIARVKLIEYQSEPDYMVAVTHNGKKVFVEYNSFGTTYPAAITGENVRLRKAPSTGSEVLAVFRKWTIIGYLYKTDGEPYWARVTYQGRTGWVSKDYVTGW